MSKVAAFHSAQEVDKPANKRVYHNNNSCPAGQDIRPKDRRDGTGGYRLCEDCDERN